MFILDDTGGPSSLLLGAVGGRLGRSGKWRGVRCRCERVSEFVRRNYCLFGESARERDITACAVPRGFASDQKCQSDQPSLFLANREWRERQGTRIGRENA